MASVSANPFAIEYVTLVAPHTPDECLRRIRDSIHTYFALPLSPDEMLLSGSIFGKHVTVYKYGRGGRRGIHTIATGRMRPDPLRGTVIGLRVSLPFGLYFWLAMMSLFLTVFIPALAFHALGTADTFGIIFCLLFTVFYAAALVTLWRQRGDRAFLVETLARILNAQVSP